MTKQKDHLHLRGNTYHVRLDIPADVRPLFGHRRLLSQSLKTGDKRLAKERAPLVIAQWKAEIRAARGEKEDQREVWMPDIVRGVGNFEEVMDSLLLKVVKGTLPDPIEQLLLGGLDAIASEWQGDDRHRIYRHLKLLEHAEGPEQLTQFLRRYSDSDEPSPTDRFFELRAFLRSTLPALWSQQYALNAAENLEAQNLVRRPETYKPKSPFSTTMLERFFTYLPTQVKDSTALQYRLQISTFSEWLEQTGHTLSFKTVEIFLDTTSTNAVTRKGYLSALKKLHKWLLRNDDYYSKLFPDGSNPFTGHEHARRGRDGGEKWDIYTKGQVEQLHAASVARNDQELADLIAVAAYTGCRNSELGWLRSTHITIENDAPIAITVDDAKTKAGNRTIPICDRIKPVMNRLMSNPKGTHQFLFSGPNRLKGRSRTPALAERFTKLKQSLGHTERQVFHSIRKCFATELDNARADPLVIVALMGHETRHITFDTYSGGPTLERKQEAINLLHYQFQLVD
ncbi:MULTISPECIES: DUF6538 domain-containing protein [unclassified Pseudomonas]|uniref:DUF6538 domain-containing protein n=1 Tax=unclassified Pseudomonas TaxID=196821 RepID=UPI002447CA3E|nr:MULTISPECIES: DUF6538 domain-containing protein [unclassified Pseudomonas]MDH0892893.1 site-specific integrase [Pseudomonas sp. GD03875]MDH1064633.1 site-specific integrase [Pseudomonas sp. GD03985]